MPSDLTDHHVAPCRTRLPRPLRWPPAAGRMALVASIIAWLLPAFASAGDSPSVDFSRDVLPILSQNCFLCHGPDAKARKADLRLDSKQSALRTNEPVIVPGKSAESELIRRTQSTDADEAMPPLKSGRKLSGLQKETLRRWVDQGARWGKHWAFEPPRPIAPPTVHDPCWARNPIDRFVLARLESERMKPSPEADRRALIRRLSLDLTGLPPTPAEVDAFLSNTSPRAYEELVDRLLASPHYGERMAMDWLDGARYADTNGYQNDFSRTMWPWRDWVISAFNRNEPYDEFVTDQMAGDLLTGATLEQRIATGFNRNNRTVTEAGSIDEEWRIENAVDRVETTATVFLGLTMGCARCHDHKFDPISQKEFYQFLSFFSRVSEKGVYTETRGNVPPLVSVPTPDEQKALAKLDALIASATTARDSAERSLPERQSRWERDMQTGAGESGPILLLYQRMFSPASLGDIAAASALAIARTPAASRSKAGELFLARYYKKLVDRELSQANDRLASARKQKQELQRRIPTVMVMEDLKTPPPTYVLKRGRYDMPDTSQKVTPGVPGCLSPMPENAPASRLGLARWLVSADNPLTARVGVNRLWQQHFGMGLVKTAENFGLQSEPPSHPELLDWLATEFIRLGWDQKALHRLIVTSATYRQASNAAPSSHEHDPENRLLSRGPRFRLPAELVRDNALAIAGLLSPKIGGPSVKPYQPAGLWEELAGGAGEGKYVQDRGPNLYRRSLYVYRKRTVPHPAMATFDAPSREVCQVKRARTNTPLQALELLNDVTYVEAATHLAKLMMTQGGNTPQARLTYAFRRATARAPRDFELKIALRGLERYRQSFRAHPELATQWITHGENPVPKALDPIDLAAYTAAASVILNLDETITRE
jgi:hypothetical protein